MLAGTGEELTVGSVAMEVGGVAGLGKMDTRVLASPAVFVGST